MHRKNHFGKYDASVFLLAIIVLMLLGGTLTAIFTFRSDPVEELISNEQVISVMYVIEHERMPLSTFVLMCYPGTRRAVIFDIPSDLGMLIRRINRVDRIDSVYDPDRVSNYKAVVESLLGVEIAFSIVITSEDIGKAVDLIEGVEVFIPSRLEVLDGDMPILFSSGLNRLDGDKAVSFISFSIPDEENEMAAARRQRFFLGFLRRQAEMNDVLKHPAVSQVYHSFMQTSLNRRGRIRLFDEIANIDMERISMQTVGGNRREVSGNMLLIPFHDGNLARDIVRQVLVTLTRPTDEFSADRVFTVEVLNGTTVNGLAGRTAEILRGFGYDVISIGNAEHSGIERTLIIDRSGYDEMARTFAGIVRCRNIIFETPDQPALQDDITMQGIEYRADFTLVLGRDFNGRYVTGN